MKELSIEEKAKAYDRALEIAKAWCKLDNNDLSNDDLETLFPELKKESEDERIRKVLVELVKCNERSGYTLLNNVSTSSMLAWLEKHKYNWTEEDEEHIHSLLDRLEGMCKKGATFTATRFSVHEDMVWLKSLKSQNTWKPSDEQMVVLELASKYERVFTPKQISVLIDLKEQLKKLKGE